jgi:hypothetical protein
VPGLKILWLIIAFRLKISGSIHQTMEWPTMKTNIFTPNFFLAHKDQLIRINTKMKIGRSQGDIVLEDDSLLSAIHCEINPMLLDVHIRDLDSTNGVYINNQKILPQTDFKLTVGDFVKIGSREYIFFDNEKEAKKIMPKPEKRKHPRPKNLHGPENLLTFYAAPYLFRGIYLIVMLGAVASFLLNIHIDVSVPENLKFLSNLYSDQIIFSGIKTVFLIWIISLIHSFLMVLYLNRNPVRKGLGLACYLALLFVMVDFKHGPLSGVKGYIVERKEVEALNTSEKGIVSLKNIVTHKNAFTKSYEFTKYRLEEKEQKVLERDYTNVMMKMESKISKIK